MNDTAQNKKSDQAFYDLISIEGQKLNELRPLFARHKRMRMVIESVLEGSFGKACADQETRPELGLVIFGGISALAGNHDNPVAEYVIENLNPGLVLTDSDQWQEAIREKHKNRVIIQNRTSFSSEKLEAEHLQSLIDQISSEYKIMRINEEMTIRMASDLETDLELHAYGSGKDFVARGIGYAALFGGKIVCVATGFIGCSKGIEIQIVTHEKFRKKGLAVSTGAALIKYCLDHNLEPGWDAENFPSCKLAMKLGYDAPDPYKGLIIQPH